MQKQPGHRIFNCFFLLSIFQFSVPVLSCTEFQLPQRQTFCHRERREQLIFPETCVLLAHLVCCLHQQEHGLRSHYHSIMPEVDTNKKKHSIYISCHHFCLYFVSCITRNEWHLCPLLCSFWASIWSWSSFTSVPLITKVS